MTKPMRLEYAHSFVNDSERALYGLGWEPHEDPSIDTHTIHADNHANKILVAGTEDEARQIVRAVNHHDALVAALREAVAWISKQANATEEAGALPDADTDALIDRIDATLAAAVEKEDRA